MGARRPREGFGAREDLGTVIRLGRESTSSARPSPYTTRARPDRGTESSADAAVARRFVSHGRRVGRGQNRSEVDGGRRANAGRRRARGPAGQRRREENSRGRRGKDAPVVSVRTPCRPEENRVTSRAVFFVQKRYRKKNGCSARLVFPVYERYGICERRAIEKRCTSTPCALFTVKALRGFFFFFILSTC